MSLRRKLFASSILTFALLLATPLLSIIPSASDTVEDVSLGSISTPVAEASDFDAFACWAIGGVLSRVSYGVGGVIVAFACTRPGRNADAICADRVWYTYDGIYGSRRTHVSGKYYLYGRSTCDRYDWQYSGGIYNASWSYIR